MWDTLENVFYILIFLLFISTFLPKPIRARVRESLGELWRVLPHLWRSIEPHAYRLVTGRNVPEQNSPERFIRTEPNATVRDDFPLPAVENTPDKQASSVREPTFALSLTEQEITAVARMIAHNKVAEKPNQTSSIEAGFGYKRGGGPGYDRAKAIYQAIFTLSKVAAFPELTPEKQRVQSKHRAARAERAS